MRARPSQDFVLAGGDPSVLSRQDAEYLAAWDQLTPEQRSEMARHGIHGPKLERHHQPNHQAKAPDLDVLYQRHGYHYEEPVEQEVSAIALAVSRLLYAITASHHPLCSLLGQILAPALFRDHKDLELELATLSCVIAKGDDKALADVARRFGVVRATVQKRGRELRQFEIIKAIQSFAHGGTQEASEAARERATIDHKKRKETQCKPSPFNLI